MKKSFVFILMMLTALAGMPSVMAMGPMPEPMLVGASKPSFFESIDHLNQLKSYTMDQGFSGNFQVEMNARPRTLLSGDFHLALKGDTENTKPYEANSSMKFKGSVHLKIEGRSSVFPFKDLKAVSEGEVRTIQGDGFYFKIDSLTLDMKGSSAEEASGVADFKNGLQEAVKPILGQWLHGTENNFAQTLGADTLGVDLPAFDQKKWDSEVRSQGLEKTFEGAVGDYVKTQTEADLSSEDAQQIETVLNKLFAMSWFRTQAIVSGKNKGFTGFYLDKRGIMQAFTDLMAQFGEPLSEADTADMQSVFSKFNISGLVSLNDVTGVYDHLLARVRLANMRELQSMVMNYRGDISGVNGGQKVVAPTDFIPAEESGLPIFAPGASPEDLLNPDWLIQPTEPTEPEMLNPYGEPKDGQSFTSLMLETAIAKGQTPVKVKNFDLQPLPEGIDAAQQGDTYTWGPDLTFQFILQPNSHVKLSGLTTQAPWAGVLVSQNGGTSWDKWYTVKAGTKYNPVGLLVNSGRVLLDLANDNEIPGGEGGGDLLRLNSTDGGDNWNTEACYYYLPAVYIGNEATYINDYLPYPLNRVRNTCGY